MKKLTLIVMTASLISLVFFSCAASSKSADSRQFRSGGPESQDREMPRPSDEELAIIRLQFLAETEQTSLALKAEQAEKILPILQEWQQAVSEDPESSSDKFAKQISSELTDEQNEMIPPPPGGMGGPQGGGSGSRGDRPSEGSRPGEMDMSELLADVINVLKKL